MLGNLLNKRPGAKKVESFMAKYLQQLIDKQVLDTKIQSKFIQAHAHTVLQTD